MGRRAARATHLGLSALGAVLYFLFIIPRWWVLTGDFPATLGTVGRIAAGVPIAAAAVPVMLTLQRSLTSEPKAPELALRLRAWSAVLHVVAGMLIIATAVVEIWLRLEVAGPWLFAVYGAAGAIAALAILAFVLSFTAEKPPAPAKPAKVKADKPKKEKRSRKRGTATDETVTAPEVEDAPSDIDVSRTAETKETSSSDAEEVDAGEPAEVAEVAEVEVTPTEDAEPESGVLLNQRPTGKKRHRLRR